MGHPLISVQGIREWGPGGVVVRRRWVERADLLQLLFDDFCRSWRRVQLPGGFADEFPGALEFGQSEPSRLFPSGVANFLGEFLHLLSSRWHTRLPSASIP